MSNQRRFALIGRGFGSDNFDEYAQDLVGALLIDSTELDFTYTDATPSITAALKTASVVFAKLQNFDALSVLGRSANSAGVGDEIAAATDGDILRRSGTTLGFGQTLPGNYTFSGTNLFTADVEILGVVTGVHVTIEDTSTGGITLVGGTPTTTSPGGDIRLTAGAGGFTSGDGGIVLIRGGATGTSPAGRAALEGGRAFGTGAGGDVGFQGGQSDAGQGGHGTFYSGTGATHVGDLYFGLGQNGAYIALRIVGDTHAWEIGGSAGTASQSILQSGGSAAAPSWLTAGTNDRLLAQTGGTLAFQQLTAGMFPSSICTSLTGSQLTFAATEIQLDATTFDFNGAADISGNLQVNGGVLRSYGANGSIRFQDTGSAANNRVWDFVTAGDQFRGRVINDAENNSVEWLLVDRTAQTIDLITFVATDVLYTTTSVTYSSPAAQATLQLAADGTGGADSGDRCLFDFGAGSSVIRLLGYDSSVTTFRTALSFNVATGGLSLGEGSVTISGTGETLATFVDDGACTLYHNNTARIATSATGVDVLAGLLLTVASATGGAGLRLPHGAAPTTPTDGDMWTTTAGLFVRINGVTVGPLS